MTEQSRGGRGFSRQGEAPAVVAPLGKSERGPRATSRRSWGSRWWPAAVAPRRGADGGGLLRRGGAPVAIGRGADSGGGTERSFTGGL